MTEFSDVSRNVTKLKLCTEKPCFEKSYKFSDVCINVTKLKLCTKKPGFKKKRVTNFTTFARNVTKLKLSLKRKELQIFRRLHKCYKAKTLYEKARL
ncbi:MAG: hypothetical protein B6247_12520 [Candidatus Parabeggiatoa sp. nov. 2]|nr:MAG: hypothetical protein B6247_12520 [Beggiatoa sp. 4572_84]